MLGRRGLSVTYPMRSDGGRPTRKYVPLRARPRLAPTELPMFNWLSVANIHPRPGSTAPPCPSNLVIPLHGRLVSVMQASEPRPRHSSAAWNLGYCRAAAGGSVLLLARRAFDRRDSRRRTRSAVAGGGAR